MNASSKHDTTAASSAGSDTVAVVLTTGTPLGDWGPLAAALIGAAPTGTDLRAAALATWCDTALGDVDARLAAGAVTWLDSGAGVANLHSLTPPTGTLWGGVDPRLCWAIGALDSVWPHAHWIVFVEAPAIALARRLTGAGPFDAQAVLNGWCSGAGELLGLLRRAPERCLVIEATEARWEQMAATTALTERLGLPFATPVPAAPSSVDPLARATAEGCIPPSHEARTLYAELLAASLPLGDGSALAFHPQDIASRWRLLHESASRAATLSADVNALRSDLESRSVQLEQMHEELEYYHCELEELKRRPALATVSAVDRPGLTVDRIELGQERDTPPHWELAIRAELLRVPNGVSPSVDFRLVEHNGRAGLVVFGDAGRSVLGGWMESGQEDGRGYMLLVPSDRNTWPAARVLTVSDELLIQTLLDRLTAEIPGSDVAHKAFWSLVAARFRQEWLECSTLLRCDPLSATLLPAGERGPAVELALGPTALGNRLVDGLRVRLRRGPLVELAGADGHGLPPLPSWPLRPGAGPVPTWELPVGASSAVAQGRGRWDRTTAADRAFLVALLEALPGLVARPEVQLQLHAGGLSDVPIGLPPLANEARASMKPGFKRRVAALVRGWRRG